MATKEEKLNENEEEKNEEENKDEEEKVEKKESQKKSLNLFHNTLDMILMIIFVLAILILGCWYVYCQFTRMAEVNAHKNQSTNKGKTT